MIKRLLHIYTTERIKNTSNPFETMVAIIPFSRRKIEQMSPEKLQKAIERQEKRLNCHGVERILLSKTMKKFCIDKGIRFNESLEAEGKRLFLMLAPQCIRHTTKKCGINLMNASVCIRDTKMDRISECLMRALCYDIKNLTVATLNKAYADTVCEAFYDETGFLVKVSGLPYNKGDVFIDVDYGEVKIGRDLYVREADFGFDFKGYDVNQLEAAVRLITSGFDTVKWIYSYER
ncbi:MAG: hypothetical protein Q4A86_03195 [Clostridia bacterium]|nr:hypothetical protein [Clostridia bacterium]